MIETYLLEQLESVARLGTLSAAAEELHVTQPSISRAMQKLEGELGVTLFERGKNKVTLNENGLVAAEYAKKILETQAQMISHLQTLEHNLTSLSFGSVAPGPGFFLWPKLETRFSAENLSHVIEKEEILLEGLEKNLYHFIILDHEINTPNLASKFLCTEHLYASLPPEHHYAKKEKLYFRELNGDSFLMVDEVGIWADVVRAQMPDSRLIIQHGLENLEELIEASNIPGFATDITLESYRASNRLEFDTSTRVAVPFADEAATLSFYLVYQKSNREKLKPLLTF